MDGRGDTGVKLSHYIPTQGYDATSPANALAVSTLFIHLRQSPSYTVCPEIPSKNVFLFFAFSLGRSDYLWYPCLTWASKPPQGLSHCENIQGGATRPFFIPCKWLFLLQFLCKFCKHRQILSQGANKRGENLLFLHENSHKKRRKGFPSVF